MKRTKEEIQAERNRLDNEKYGILLPLLGSLGFYKDEDDFTLELEEYNLSIMEWYGKYDLNYRLYDNEEDGTIWEGLTLDQTVEKLKEPLPKPRKFKKVYFLSSLVRDEEFYLTFDKKDPDPSDHYDNYNRYRPTSPDFKFVEVIE